MLIGPPAPFFFTHALQQGVLAWQAQTLMLIAWPPFSNRTTRNPAPGALHWSHRSPVVTGVVPHLYTRTLHSSHGSSHIMWRCSSYL